MGDNLGFLRYADKCLLLDLLSIKILVMKKMRGNPIYDGVIDKCWLCDLLLINKTDVNNRWCRKIDVDPINEKEMFGINLVIPFWIDEFI